MAKRQYGDGSIVENPKGVWRVQVSFGKDPVTGKSKRAVRRVHGTRRDAMKVRDELRAQYDSGLSFDASRMTFLEYANEWLKSRERAGLAASTLDDCRRVTRILCGYLGAGRLKDLNTATVESTYRRIEDERGIKPGRLRKYHVTLKMILDSAIDHDLMLRNPCDRVKLPKRGPVERRSLSIFEVGKLSADIATSWNDAVLEFEAKESRQFERGNDGSRQFVVRLSKLSHIAAAQIGLSTGMRLGEVYGLAWDDVNLDGLELRVTHSLAENGERKAPKTKSGLRIVSIDGTTGAMLEQMRSIQAKALSTIGVDVRGASPVLCSNVGGWIDRHNHQRWWSEWTASHGFNGLKFHELRHTQATQLLANGVDVKTVQSRLGHSSASITLDFYAHAIRDNDRKAAALIGRMIKRDGLDVDGKGGDSKAV